MSTQAVSTAAGDTLPPPDVCVFRVPLRRNGKRGRKENGWRDVVEVWEKGLPAQDVLPMKDWPRKWLQGPARTAFAQQYSNRKIIAEEFIVQ